MRRIRGYRGLKCKARAFYDVVECARTIQDAAPPDFRVEFDFNGALICVEKALPVLRELEKIPVVKGVEEPIFAYDIDGWRRLHREIRIPFYLHGVRVLSEGRVPAAVRAVDRASRRRLRRRVMQPRVRP